MFTLIPAQKVDLAKNWAAFHLLLEMEHKGHICLCAKIEAYLHSNVNLFM